MLVYCTHPGPAIAMLSYHNIRGRWLVAFTAAGGYEVRFRTEIVTAAAGSHLSSVVIYNEPHCCSQPSISRYTRQGPYNPAKAASGIHVAGHTHAEVM